MKIKEKIIVLDFGGQCNELIARRIRDIGTYAEVLPYTTSVEDIKKMSPIGIVFSGGPNSVYEENAPKVDASIFDLGIPILGICYGAQLIAQLLGGEVAHTNAAEFGESLIAVLKSANSKLLENVSEQTRTFMSHNDYIKKAPEGFVVTAQNEKTPIAAMENQTKNIYAVQWHPEVKNSLEGNKIFENFVTKICKAKNEWNMDNYIPEKIEELKNQIGSKKVLLALSGGVDSSVTAALLSKAIGKNLTCVFVNHGLLRKNEAKEVCSVFGEGNKNFDLNFVYVDASKRYYDKLKCIEEPERKRKIIGEEFIRIFEEEAKKLGNINFLAQGTIYPDIIESGKGGSATIKSHHNVGGLPKDIGFEGIIEPLKYLFKDEVRKLGLKLGLREELVTRQPFPGPGLAIRIVGEVTEEKIQMVQDADYIFREELKKAGEDKKIAQCFAALTNMKSVGVKGDQRTYDYAIVLRAVVTDDFMTCTAADIPYDLMQKVMTRIVDEVAHINRVLYDTTSKPPATVELE